MGAVEWSNIVVAGRALAVRREVEGFAIECYTFALLFVSCIDGVAQVCGFSIQAVIYLVAHEDVFTAHTRPAIAGEVKGLVVYIHKGAVSLPAVLMCGPAFTGACTGRLQRRDTHYIVASIATGPVAHKVQFAVIRRKGGILSYQRVLMVRPKGWAMVQALSLATRYAMKRSQPPSAKPLSFGFNNG